MFACWTKTKKVKAPVKFESPYYKIDHLERGKAVILNHRTVNEKSSNADETDKDEESLFDFLKSLKFQVETYNNLKKFEVLQKIDELKEDDHENRDCLVVFVLSDGFENEITCSDGVSYRPDDLWKSFTENLCPTLAGKPKLFFFVTCKENQVDATTQISSLKRYSSCVSIYGEPCKTYMVPNSSDFLIVHSSTPGNFQFWENDNGSWFIQILVRIWKENLSQLDLVSVLTNVTKDAASNYECSDQSEPVVPPTKQVPVIISTLTRLFRL